MLVKAGLEALYHSSSQYQRLLSHNGGYDTLTSLLEEKEPLDWIGKLEDLPTSEYYINENGQKIFLSHAGYSFWADEPKPKIKDKDLLWDRLHFYDSANLLSSIVVVHGHTPIRHLAREINTAPLYGALKYANGKKYCIDAGTFFTNRSILFNLDTFKSIIIK